MKKTNDRAGFTLVELIIVIGVIAILAMIGVGAMLHLQASARDSQRNMSVTTFAEALEKYYSNNGEYPSCKTLTSNSTAVSTLLGIDNAIIKFPENTNANSIVCSDISGSTNDDVIAYIGDGSTACATGESCLLYTLKYKEEATGRIVSVPSRHSASISTSGLITLSAGSVTYTSTILNWNTVPNATGYVLQRARDANFTNSLVQTSYSAPDQVQSGLTAATLYYYRVRPVSATGEDLWSNIVVQRTSIYAPTGLTATANSATQITASWTAVSGAASYRLQYSTSSTFASGVTTIDSITTTSRAVTGLAQGTTYYFRVYAVAGNDSSTASETKNASTSIDAPSAPVVTVTATSGTSNSVTWSWNSVTCLGGSPTYTTALHRDDSTGWRAWTADSTSTSRTETTNYEGYQYKVKVKAKCVSSNNTSSGYSAESNQPAYIRLISKPGKATKFTANTVDYATSGITSRWLRMSWTAPSCGLGTTPIRQAWGAAGNKSGGGAYGSEWTDITRGNANFVDISKSRWRAETFPLSNWNWSYFSMQHPNSNDVTPTSIVTGGEYYRRTYIDIDGWSPVNSTSQEFARAIVVYACYNTETSRVGYYGSVADSGRFFW